MQDYDEDDMRANFVVSYFDNEIRLYSLFSSYDEFWTWYSDFPNDQRAFYEVVRGEQKPHFDIDMTDNLDTHEKVLESLIRAIVAVIDKLGAKFSLSNLLVFSSHGDKKKSYHVVVASLYTCNNLECKEFYNLCMEHVPDHHRIYIDKSVYSSRQNFRLYLSQKYGSGRVKMLDMKFAKDMDVVFREKSSHEIFSSSLLVNTESCERLPIYISAPPDPVQTNANGIISTEAIIRMVNAKHKKSLKFSGIKDDIYTFQRIKPSYCDACKRIHESENAYVIVADGKALFNCRRNDDFVDLGYAGGDIDEVIINKLCLIKGKIDVPIKRRGKISKSEANFMKPVSWKRHQ